MNTLAKSFARIVLSSLCCYHLTANATTYYVDGGSGDDSRRGTTPEHSWKSLQRVNQQIFQPGDQILLKAGTRYAGQLKPQGSGASREGRIVPIVISSFGSGSRPRIDAGGKFLDAVLLRNVEFWEVRNLEITNLGEQRQPWQTGVRIVSDGFGKMRHIHLSNLFVHDVNGDLSKEKEGCGIYFESRGGNGSHFDDLLIENCHVLRTDRNGICQRSSGRTRSLRVVIRGNLLEDIGGDGIKVWGSNGALIEHNTIRGGRMRCDDHAAGIWPFASDDTLIQFNEVSGMRGIKDGQGFDADYLWRRSVFQYNYSHDNEGGFILICAPGHSYNEDTIVRYNISQNDGINTARVFHFGGAAKNTQVYNNTIYVGPKQDLPLVLFTEWDGGHAAGTRFYNNLFYVAGRATYDWGKARDTIFENNIFCGPHVQPPPDARGTTNCPPLTSPGTGGNGFDSVAGYQLKPGSESPSGRMVQDNGGRDFFGKPVSTNKPPRIGASE
ncbi:MAG: right-handed parallel beta-helix repeat-containing protein [Verrucomicrobiota bacterium]